MSTMPILILVAAIVASSGCKKKSEDPVLSARRMQALAQEQTKERLERERVEAENLRTMLTPLVKTRKELLKEKAEKLATALKEIASDKRLAEHAVASVEDRRGLEYTVYNVMTNQDLNALSVKYTGGDFGALKSEFTEAVRFHKTSRTELTQAMQNNASEYNRQVKGIDQAVDVANQSAQDSVNAAHANILKRIEKIEKEKKNLLMMRNVKEDDPRLTAINMQLERLEQLLELSGGSTEHVKATVMESSARRKFDRALDEKESKDAAAISANQFKGDLYNAAQIYRGRSIDRLLNAMTSQAAVLSERLCSLESALETLEESEARMRIMEYADLAQLRESIMRDARFKLEDGLTNSKLGR